MEQLNIRLTRLKVNRFSLKENSVEVCVCFNDGSKKEITKTFAINHDSELQTDELFIEIRNMIKNIHQRIEQGSIVDSIVNISFQDEDASKDKISLFLARLFDKIKIIKNATQAEGYLAKFNEIQHMSLEM